MVYKVDTTGTYTTVYKFTGSDGTGGALALSQAGILYGTGAEYRPFMNIPF
jgi:hypothetical protein